MKILALKYRNINSLKSDGSLDFTAQPLNDSGLFAITGKTGSGKSTLLDIICLALYNQIPRYESSFSKNTIANDGAIVTKNCNEAMAEVKYQCNKGTFVSRWSISKARTGNFRDYDMEVSDENGNIIPATKSEVPDINSSNLGLTFDQFTKSVLLAQGDFAKFLKTNSKERSNLLEKITGTEIYSRIGAKIYEQHKRIKEVYDKINNELNSKKEIIISDEQYNELIDNIKKSETEIEIISEKIKQNDKIKDDLSQLEKLNKQKTNNEQLLASHKTQLNDFYDKYETIIKKHKELLPIESDINNWSSISDRLNKHKNKEENIIHNLKDSQSNYDEIINNISSFIDKPIDDAQKDLDDFNEKYNNLLNKSNNIYSEYKNNLELIKNINLSEFSINSFKKTHSIDDAIKLENDFKKQISILNEYFTTNDIKCEPEEIDNLNRIKQNIFSLKTEKKQLDYNNEMLENISQKISENEKIINELPEKIKTNENEAEKLQLKIDKLNAEIELKKFRAKYEDDRKKLESGKECPLCGSTHHPFVTEYPDNETDEDENNLKQFNKELKKINKLITEFQQDQKNISMLLNELSKERNSYNDKSIEIKENIIKLEKQIGDKFLKFEYDKANKFIDNAIKNIQSFKEISEKLEKIDSIKTYALKAVSLYNEYEKLNNAIKEMYSGNDFKTDHDKLKNNLRTSSDSLKKAENNKEIWEEEYYNLSDEYSNISNELSPKLQNLGYDKIEDGIENLLSSNKYNELIETSNNLINNIKSIESKLEVIHSSIKSIKIETSVSLDELLKEQADNKKQLKNLNVIRDKYKAEETTFLNLKNEISKLSEELKKITPDMTKWNNLNNIIGDLTGNKFKKYAQHLTLKQLIIYANRRIKELSGRYFFKFPENENEDTFRVIDRDMGDTERVITTLSGGETFLLSLALALALSDLAAKNVRINSMFIDEGFGSLDQETLDQTLDTLERLQGETEKKIGIISHVETLKERITTQIEVIPNGQGFSKLEIRS